ncbi:unnamed protein product, partial [Meganyctiphanes norvegica]
DCLYWKGSHYKHLGTKPEKPGIGFADGNCDMQRYFVCDAKLESEDEKLVSDEDLYFGKESSPTDVIKLFNKMKKDGSAFSSHSKTRICPSDYIKIKGQCLKFQARKRLTWHMAVHECQDMGGSLATLLNPQAQSSIMAEDYKGKEFAEFWIGASDFDHEGSWKWIDGDLINFPWAPGKPGSNDDKNCLLWLSRRLGYVDHGCKALHHFVCEDHMVAGLCPGGYIPVGAQCLSFIVGAHLNYTAAQKYCRGDHADLATIMDPHIVAKYITEYYAEKDFWFGASDNEMEGEWLWVTGDPLEFPWAAGQPDNQNQEDCMYWAANPQGFYDGSCGHTKLYICEVPLQVPIEEDTDDDDENNEYADEEGEEEDDEIAQGRLEDEFGEELEHEQEEFRSRWLK